MMSRKDEINIAILAAKEACKEILNIYTLSEFLVESKNDNSPLTLADKKSHETIVKLLNQTNLPILSEEGRRISFSERKKWKRFWLIDPLDGTKEFIQRNGEFTVNIALIENNQPVWGVVGVPVTNTFYYIDEYNKVVKEYGTKKVVLLPYSEIENSMAHRLTVVFSRSHMDEKTKRYLATLDKHQLISMGSSLKFMLVAEGKAQLYPRFAPTSEWDTAASHAILNKLGYSVYKVDSNEELIYNKENVLNPGFIVTYKMLYK